MSHSNSNKHSDNDNADMKPCSCGCSFDLEGPNKGCESCQCTPLNRLCHSLLNTNNCKQFLNAPEKYCRNMGLSQIELEAVTDLDVMRLLELGARPVCLETLTQVFQLSVNTLGAEQTLIDEEEFITQIDPYK